MNLIDFSVTVSTYEYIENDSGSSDGTCAERLTVSTLNAVGSSLLSTPCATEVFPVPTGPTNMTG